MKQETFHPVNNKKKRLIIDIPVDMHNDIKMICAARNVSIKDYVLSLVVPVIIQDKELLG